MLPHTYYSFFFFFNDTATTEIYTLSLHDALPIWSIPKTARRRARCHFAAESPPGCRPEQRCIPRLPHSPTDERRPRGVSHPVRTRRDGPARAPSGAGRRHAARGVREGRAISVRVPARVARRRRALGPLHLPRHRAARGMAVPRPGPRPPGTGDGPA